MKNEQRWYTWGSPVAAQQGEYLTYAKYVERCKEEETEPVQLDRFIFLMHRRGICIAPEDEHGDKLFWCYDYKRKEAA